MVEKIQHPIKIDLNQFKLHIGVKNKIELTLHFDSPSRRFYLSLIAFVVNQMKRLGKITSIPLQDHLELIALLNTTVGSSAGSSEKENLLPRVYMKWKGALPNLEEAPLFRILGMKKEYDEGAGRTYQFTDAEKDSWANLFEYKGSRESVRLRFSIDRLGMGLDDVAIDFGGYLNGEAWERFISSLKPKVKVESKTAEPGPAIKGPEDRVSMPKGWKIGWSSQYRSVALIAFIGVVLGAAGFTIWKTYWNPVANKVASQERIAFPLPDVPSIAVLPFVNMSGDPKQDYFSDGLTEEIINGLSKVPRIFVIARNSTFAYKGKSVDVKQVGREMGVKYVMEGSVRREGNRLRITARLVDATTGLDLFSERYDRELKGIFATQDEITIKVLTALRVALTEGEYARYQTRWPSNAEAYFKLLEAFEIGQRVNRASNARVRQLAEEALALEPGLSRAYSILAYTHFWDYWLGSPRPPDESIARGIEMAKKSIALDKDNFQAHGALAMLYVCKAEYEKAVEEAEESVSINPGSLFILGSTLMHASRFTVAITVLQKALRFYPGRPHSMCLSNLANSYRMIGQYEQAVEYYKRLLQDQPDHFLGNAGLTATYCEMGRLEEARTQAAEVLRVDPKFSLERYSTTLRYKNPADKERYIDALRKAGLK
jgi:TolB-like protein